MINVMHKSDVACPSKSNGHVNDQLLKDLYLTMIDTCVSLGVSLDKEMTYFEMLQAITEKASTKSLYKVLSYFGKDDSEFFRKNKRIVLKELWRRRESVWGS